MLLATYDNNTYSDILDPADVADRLENLVLEFEKRLWLNDLTKDDNKYFIDQLQSAISDIENLGRERDEFDLGIFINSATDIKELKREMKMIVHCGTDECTYLEEFLDEDDLKKLARMFVDTEVNRVVINRHEMVIYYKKEEV